MSCIFRVREACKYNLYHWFVRQWIPGQRLQVVISEASIQWRQKRLEQIRQSVHILIVKGIIWDDWKASIVIIDEQDGAWLVDVGGGWCKGWVLEDAIDTLEGDGKIIRRLQKLLELENEVGPRI